MNIPNYRNYLLLLLLVGFVVYFPGLFNGFAWDDYPFILANSGIHQLNLPILLQQSVFNWGMFYRPIPAIYFSILYTIFGQNAFFYHFIQISLHNINSILLFLLFLRFFPKTIAFFLALLYLIHPINVESVAFISSTTSEIYFLFGMIAFLLGIEKQITNKKIGIIFVLLLLAVLTKETGLLFLPLLLLYRYLYKLEKIGTFVLLGISTVATYILLRISVGGVTYSSSNSLIPIKDLSLMDRLVNIPPIFWYYIKTFIFPWDLSIWQLWVKTVNFQDFFIPLMICLSLVIALVGYIRYIDKQDDGRLRGLIFFTCWYILGMVLIVQIVPLDMTVADRWFYFPIVGVLGIIGIGLQHFTHSYQKHKRVYIIFAVLLISLLSIRTMIRVLDWKDNLTLYKHDAQVDPNNMQLTDQLAVALYNENRIDEALLYANRSVSISPNYKNLNHLGTIYKMTKQYDKAILAYTRAIQSERSTPDSNLSISSGLIGKTDKFLLDAYIGLAETYILAGRISEAIPIIDEGLNIFPNSSQLYFNLAYAEYKLGNAEKAIAASKKSYELSPNEENSYLYYHLKNGIPLDGK